jgi:polar amino acid transport system permease protein
VYEFDWQVLWDNAGFVAQGIPITLTVSVGGILIGLVLGVPIALGLVSTIPFLPRVLRAYVEVFRNIPLLVQIVWFYYVLPIATGYQIEPLQAGTLAVGLNASAYIAEIIRGGITGIAAGQTEASRSLGMSYGESMRHVILPQTGRRMVAPMANMFVVLIKESALVSYIGVLDILHRGDIVQVSTFAPLESYTLVAVYFFVIVTVVTLLMRWVERRFAVAE